MDASRQPIENATAQVSELSLAVRRARIDAAQHSEAVAELRGAEIARLEMLEEALKPVLAQVPSNVDLFDAGLTPGDKPRYFIDMLAFVEMARDRRSYRFLQDTRHGRLTVVESDKPGDIVEAVTAYIARRLVEREQALASDQTVEQAAQALLARRETEASGEPEELMEAEPRQPGYFFSTLRLAIDMLGTITLLAALAALAHVLWNMDVQQWIGWLKR